MCRNRMGKNRNYNIQNTLIHPVNTCVIVNSKCIDKLLISQFMYYVVSMYRTDGLFVFSIL